MRDLNHPKISKFTRDVAATLDVDRSFAEFVFVESKPACFEFRCQPAECGWTCYVPDNVDVAYPLWSSNADQTLLIVSRGAVTFADGYHDDPTIDRISSTSQGLLAKLFISLYESEVADEELTAAAAFAGFRFLDDCIQFQNSNGADYANWDSLLAGFIATIDVRAS